MDCRATVADATGEELHLECEEFDGLAVSNIHPSYDTYGRPALLGDGKTSGASCKGSTPDVAPDSGRAHGAAGVRGPHEPAGQDHPARRQGDVATGENYPDIRQIEKLEQAQRKYGAV